MLRTLQTATNILLKNSGKSILKFCPKAMTIFKLCRPELNSSNDKQNLAPCQVPSEPILIKSFVSGCVGEAGGH